MQLRIVLLHIKTVIHKIVKDQGLELINCLYCESRTTYPHNLNPNKKSRKHRSVSAVGVNMYEESLKAASEPENAPRFLVLEEPTQTWLIA